MVRVFSHRCNLDGAFELVTAAFWQKYSRNACVAHAAARGCRDRALCIAIGVAVADTTGSPPST